jgi:diadenosine tetraphosphate (Ap4A) HIT family hydrolase
VRHTGEPTALPVVVLLCPIAHHDLLDLPAELASELGPMLQRVEKAIMSLGGIARVHVNKWGDGSAHLHLWLIARPAGLMQLRGTCLPLWDDVLPRQEEAQWRAVLGELAAALAADGGTAHA